MQKRGFTLIELLVVIAIIAILSVVVILTLNPAELLRQSRDSNRLSDLATINTALGVYAAQGGTTFGSSNLVYVSIPDPSATSTAGDQCQGLGLPAAPSGTNYFCQSSSTSRNIDGTGWIPVNFSSISTGAPLGSLPQDPINTTTSGNYYTYATNGTQFIVTAIPESQKTKTSLGINPQIPNYPEVMAQGSNLTISPLWSPSGLVGYWNFEEGSGSSTTDGSGNANNGTWNGSSINGNHYTGGKVGNYAGNFDGSTDLVTVNSSASLQPTAGLSVAAWFNTSNQYANWETVAQKNSTNDWDLRFWGTSGRFSFTAYSNSGNSAILTPNILSTNLWYFGVGVASISQGFVGLYINGTLIATTTFSGANLATSTGNILIGLGGNALFPGQIDDLRIYNRALSASEIQALYNAEK